MHKIQLVTLWTNWQQWIWHGKPDRRDLRWLQRLSRILLYVTRDVLKGDLQLNAMSLSYTTLLSLVPLLAVSFSVLKAFGSDRVIGTFLNAILEPLGNSAPELTTRILEFVSNIKVGVLGAVGIALLFYIVIALMQKIESVFNGIWRVHQLRDLSTRLAMYLSVLMVGPVLILAAMGVTATVLSNGFMNDVLGFMPLRGIMTVVAWLFPLLMWTGTFTFIYAFIPNTRVHFSAALAGGVVAAITWNGIGLAFGSLIATSTQYTAIYSAFASLVLFMVWLQVAWLIVLLGASVSHAWQNVEHLSAHHATQQGQADRLMVAAIETLSLIAARFIQGGNPPTDDEIKLTLMQRLSLDPETTDLALSRLSSATLIRPVSADVLGWVPARPPEQLSLADIRIALFGQPDGLQVGYQPITRQWLDMEKSILAERMNQVTFAVNQEKPAPQETVDPAAESDSPKP
ncbi:MAG TPA: YihY/virulence factor BrkB family protein [Halothiobacillus sp.]|nr:YihY/virulence factor BrkB family protein [Halothiobacillus sp.]